MVKLGIICEGESEKVIFEGKTFKNWLLSLNIDLINVQDTGSKNQFYEGRFLKHRAILSDRGVDKILALFDLDEDICPAKAKSQSDVTEKDICVIAIKEFESWYLADNKALSSYLGNETVVEYPEKLSKPTKEIIRLNNSKGFGRSKPRLARQMLNSGFTIENAANHPNCTSAKYFIKKLKELSENV